MSPSTLRASAQLRLGFENRLSQVAIRDRVFRVSRSVQVLVDGREKRTANFDEGLKFGDARCLDERETDCIITLRPPSNEWPDHRKRRRRIRRRFVWQQCRHYRMMPDVEADPLPNPTDFASLPLPAFGGSSDSAYWARPDRSYCGGSESFRAPLRHPHATSRLTSIAPPLLVGSRRPSS